MGSRPGPGRPVSLWLTGRPGCTPAGTAPHCSGPLPTMTSPIPWAVRRQAYMMTAALLDQLTGHLVELCWGSPSDGQPV